MYGNRHDLPGHIRLRPIVQAVGHALPKLGPHRVELRVPHGIGQGCPTAQLLEDLEAASIRAAWHGRRVSPELGPCRRTAPQPPSPDGLRGLRASVALAILAQIDGPEAGEEGPGPRSVDSLTTGDSPAWASPAGVPYLRDAGRPPRTSRARWASRAASPPRRTRSAGTLRGLPLRDLLPGDLLPGDPPTGGPLCPSPAISTITRVFWNPKERD